MPYNNLMSEMDGTKTQISVLVFVLLLSVDAINPVKIFLRVFEPYGLQVGHLVLCVAVVLGHIFISQIRDLLYFSTKVFFNSILSIFFSKIEIIGTKHIPREGPVIFCGNHSNQFVDGIMLMTTVPEHKVSFLVAEKSWHRLIIGNFAYAMGCVPVARAQDKAHRGTGKIVIDNGGVVSGQGTNFDSQISPGDKLRLGSVLYKVTKVNSPDSLTVEMSSDDTADCVVSDPSPFDILPREDQSAVYAKVLSKLAKTGTIGIFPEGGSHDRTDLLPLKVGFALIAYEALKELDINVPIIPVGLNYFHGHRFRGRAVVEFGAPIYIDPETLPSYVEGGKEKRRVCSELIDKVADGMRSTLVVTPTYEDLRMVHTARRLFMDRGQVITAAKRQDLSRRFAVCYKLLLDKFEREGEGEPEEYTKLKKRILEYQEELYQLGIRDFQVPQLSSVFTEADAHNASIGSNRKNGGRGSVTSLRTPTMDETESFLDDIALPYKVTHMLFTILVAFVPAFLLNFPVGLLANLYAERRRKKALKASKVKIEGKDVLLSEKVILCMVFVPILWAFYGLVLVSFTNWDRDAIVLFQLSLPLFSYIGIMATEAGMADFKDLRPHLLKLTPGSRRRLRALPAKRRVLSRDFKRFVHKYGPSMGELYFKKKVDWEKIQRETKGVKQE